MARGAYRTRSIVRRISHDRSFSRYRVFKRKFVLIINVFFFYELCETKGTCPTRSPIPRSPIHGATMVIESIETLRRFYMKVYLFGAYT